MHIEITYTDGTKETMPVALEGNRVSSGRSWIPGHSVGEPSERAYMRPDFFECAIDDGKERSGCFVADEGDFQGPIPEAFDWRLVGDEPEECRSKLSAWSIELGPGFDPSLPADGQPGLPADRHRAYEDDRQCWETYLDDPAEELSRLGASPSP